MELTIYCKNPEPYLEELLALEGRARGLGAACTWVPAPLLARSGEEEVFRKLEVAGHKVRWVEYGDVLHALGPSSQIIISVDPQTLHAIFEYAAAIVAIYKSTDYFGELFEAALRKVGETIGSKVIDAFGTLWGRLYERFNERQLRRQHGTIYLHFRSSSDQAEFDIYSHISGSHYHDHDIRRAYFLVVFRLLPIVQEFYKQASSRGIKVGSVEAMLLDVGTSKSWIWELELPPVGSFQLDFNGVLRPHRLGGSGRRPGVRRRLEAEGVQHDDIAEIIQEYAESQGG